MPACPLRRPQNWRDALVAFDIFDQLDQIAAVVPAHQWMLVGGLMVHTHASAAGITHVRPTDDADLVVELRSGNYANAAAALEQLGYERHTSLDNRAPFHRFTRADGAQIDLMAPENKHTRYAGRDVLGVPGSRSALNRTLWLPTPAGTPIRVPDLGSALSLKGAAYRLPGINPTRHLQDGVTLLACVNTTPLEPSKSMRVNINHLVTGLGRREAWTASDPITRRKATRALQQIRPDWVVPDFVLPRRSSRRAGPSMRVGSGGWERVEGKANTRTPEQRRPPGGRAIPGDGPRL